MAGWGQRDSSFYTGSYGAQQTSDHQEFSPLGKGIEDWSPTAGSTYEEAFDVTGTTLFEESNLLFLSLQKYVDGLEQRSYSAIHKA